MSAALLPERPCATLCKAADICSSVHCFLTRFGCFNLGLVELSELRLNPFFFLPFFFLFGMLPTTIVVECLINYLIQDCKLNHRS